MSPQKLEVQQRIITWADDVLGQMPVLKSKLAAISILNELDAKLLLTETLKFLYLIAKYKQSLSPSIIVDLTWHEFILYTRLYHDFCMDKFGRFIHHTPGGDASENQRKFLKTLHYYILNFGEPPQEIWGEIAQKEWLESQCGSCNSN